MQSCPELTIDASKAYFAALSNSASAKTIKGEEKVLVPGDPEREMEAERKKDGIPLLQAVIDDLKELAVKFDLSFS